LSTIELVARRQSQRVDLTRTYPHGDVPELDRRRAIGGGGERRGGGEAVLVHDPAGLGALGWAALVEDERLLDANALAGGVVVDGLVGAGGLPVPGPRRPVRADAVRVLAVTRAEEVPLAIPVHSLAYILHHHHRHPPCQIITERDREMERAMVVDRYLQGRSHGSNL
jgi:hypothetical protein